MDHTSMGDGSLGDKSSNPQVINHTSMGDKSFSKNRLKTAMPSS
jgi:hypothetical protein